MLASSSRMVHYTTSGGVEQSALAIVTVDSPKLIVAVDPLFALVDFFSSAFPPAEVIPEEEDALEKEPTAESSTPAVSTLAFRVEIVNSTILVLANDTDAETQAIQLSVEQLLVSHQVSPLTSSRGVLSDFQLSCLLMPTYVSYDTGRPCSQYSEDRDVPLPHGQARRDRALPRPH